MTEQAGQTRLKQKLAAGQVATGVTLNFLHAGLAEFFGRLGFDCIIVDGEHGAITDHDIEAVARACDLTGCASMLRISTDSAQLERYINLGLTGIQLPAARSLAHVRGVVDAVKFAPQGRRGLGNSRGGMWGLSSGGFPALMEAENRRTIVMVQIEDRDGIAALPDIARIDEVDAIIVGPVDLSNDLGVPGQLDHPDVVSAVDEIFRIANEAGKPLSMGVSSTADVERAVARGVCYVVTAATRCLQQGAGPLLRAATAR